jgi:hypothetical protein
MKVNETIIGYAIYQHHDTDEASLNLDKTRDRGS